MNAPFPRAGILDIAPYQPGESRIPGHTRVIKLASNESPLGPSPRVAEALARAMGSLHLYPDSATAELRAALAARHGLEAERILCSSGSEEMIHMLARAYAGPGDEILYSQYGFIAYPIAARAAGASPVMAAEQDYTTDTAALLAAVTPRTRVLFLANPNNPTGTHISAESLREFHAALPRHVLLVLDEAYAEYADAADYRSALDLARSAGNIVVLRTFSKIYGLAALRVGWSYCPPAVIDVLNRIRCTFNVTALSQIAACTALEDEDHLATARAHNAQWLPWLGAELQAMGIRTSPSIGNFLLAHFADEQQAQAADAHLRKDGIIVRPVAGYGLRHHLRITVGQEAENRALVASLRGFMAS